MDENERSGDIGDGSGDILVMVTVLMVMDLVTSANQRGSWQRDPPQHPTSNILQITICSFCDPHILAT